MVVAPPNQVQGVQQIIVQQPQVILASDWSKDTMKASDWLIQVT